MVTTSASLQPDGAGGSLVVPLLDVAADMSDVVGHKAATLGALLRAEFPVPDGACVTTAAFRHALGERADAIERITAADLRAPDAAEAAARAISALLADLRVPAEVAAGLRAAYGGGLLAQGPLAVRSTATAEDLEAASFAGAYESALGVSGEEAVLAAIAACWRSFFTARALAARAAAGRLSRADAMAVLVQRMVDAECAGVAYSVDAVRRRPDQIVVESVWGLGAGAVDASVAGDAAWLLRADLEIAERRVVAKPDRIALSPDGGIRVESVEPERRLAACLPPQWLRRIGEFALAAEHYFGAPQDLEWAIASDRVWILQSRPITGLPDAVVQAACPFAAELLNVGARRPAWRRARRDPLPPMEMDIRAAGRSAHRDLPLADFGEHTSEVRLVHGYPYSRPVPSDLGPGDRRARQGARSHRAAWLREQGVTPWGAVAREVADATRRLDAFDAAGADGPALADHVEDAFGLFRWHWARHWEYASVGGDFREPFRAALQTMTGERDRALSRMEGRIVAGEDSEFTRLIDALYSLAQLAAGTAAAALLRDPPDDALDRLAADPEAAAFLTALKAFMAEYGGRCGQGYGSDTSIHTPTWRETPRVVLGLLHLHIENPGPSPAVLRDEARRERDAWVERLCAQSPDADAVAEFRRWLPLMRRHAADLENHNHFIDQLTFGQLRRALLAAGARLEDRGALDAVEDVFWMRRDEVAAALRADAPSGYADRVRRAKAEHDRQAVMEAPVLVGTPEPEVGSRPAFLDETTHDAADGSSARRTPRVSGMPASVGRRRGRARVVDDGSTVPRLLPGEVLVARDAGPHWTPLFPFLGAMVLDRGSMLQHAAAVAREYGVPSVIQTVDATRRIPDGAWVVVDGGAGTVEVEASPEVEGGAGAEAAG